MADGLQVVCIRPAQSHLHLSICITMAPKGLSYGLKEIIVHCL